MDDVTLTQERDHRSAVDLERDPHLRFPVAYVEGLAMQLRPLRETRVTAFGPPP